MRYTLVAANPEAHHYGVTLELDQPDPAGQVLAMPAWTPGSYMVRDFARHVIELRASCNDEPVEVVKEDKQTWRCAPCEGPIRIEWTVYAWDASVRAATLDGDGGFCNGTSVFLQPRGLPDGPFEVVIPAVADEDWRVATAMPPAEIDEAGFGRYRVADYEELIDHPIRLGRFVRHAFGAAGVPHELVIAGAERLDADRLCRDISRACEQHVALFGELPVSRYIFFMNVIGHGYGGLEHRASTVLNVARDSLPQPGDAADREEYRELLGLCSHEYFHLWHVKRIRPLAFMPLSLEAESHTTLLWAFEGITSYYDDLALLRAGLLSTELWLERIARTITRVHRGPGHRRQSVTESSFDAWTRFYKQDENAPNAIVSYYAKGALVALMLDLTLRLHSGNECSLDDLMRALWARHGRAGIGVPEDGIERLAEELAGFGLGDFFDRTLRSRTALDPAPLLSEFGIELTWEQDEGDRNYVPQLAAVVREQDGWPRLVQVIEDGAAQRAGLSAGDRIVAVDGIHLSAGDFPRRLSRLPIGEPLPVHVLRDDRLQQHELVLNEPARDRCRLNRRDDRDGETARRRAQWMGDGS